MGYGTVSGDWTDEDINWEEEGPKTVSGMGIIRAVDYKAVLGKDAMKAGALIIILIIAAVMITAAMRSSNEHAWTVLLICVLLMVGFTILAMVMLGGF